MSDVKTALVIGVGADEGLGAYLCKHAAREGLHVVIAGRTDEKIKLVASIIESHGGQATAVVADATSEADVESLIAAAEKIGPVDLAIYNAGNNFSGKFLELETELFEKAWRVCTLGGFLFARSVLRNMKERGAGTLLFTGASASLRGKPNFVPFTAAKAGLRTMSQSLAREFQPDGIHVAHVVIDGGIAGDLIIKRFPEFVERSGLDGLVGLDGIAQSYMFLYKQPRNAWTQELDLRTHKENF